MSRKNNHKLTKAEQATTVAYKLISEQNENLKKSLKKTQDELEKMRDDKFSHEIENTLLKQKQKSIFWIEFFKIISGCGIGFSLNYLQTQNYSLFLVYLVPSLVICIVTLVFSNK